jgi:hypothetical protein
VLRRDDLSVETLRTLNHEPLRVLALVLDGRLGAQDAQIAGRSQASHRQLATVDRVGCFDDRRACALTF